jgi:AraC-like DNA-binding protein
MTDPLAEIVALLQPRASLSKIASGAGAWRVRRQDDGRPFYCVVLEGACRLDIDARAPLILQANDFVLVPSMHGFTMSGLDPSNAADADADASAITFLPDEVRHGNPDGPPDVRLLVGYCAFGSPDASLLVSLLPQLVHVRGERRLTSVVQLVVDESRGQRPARDVVLARLLEVLFIEALRNVAGDAAPPGLARGLSDARLAAAIRSMHERPAHDWTVVELAKEAALSRSAFFERFNRMMGVAPMTYLLAWRMAIAKDLLRRNRCTVSEVAERVGYRSASAFSVAFGRHVGLPPARYAREGTVPTLL